MSHQCIALTKNGVRCKRRTKMTEYCSTHLYYQKGFRIKRSQIPRSDKGLYTRIERKADEKLGEYKGIIYHDESKLPKDSKTIFEINKHKFVVPRDQDGIGLQYANMCRGNDKNRGYCKGNNATFSINPRTQVANVKATKKIKPYEEIFLNYGKNYFKNDRVNNHKKAGIIAPLTGLESLFKHLPQGY